MIGIEKDNFREITYHFPIYQFLFDSNDHGHVLTPRAVATID